ncbi:hypothetical protein AB1Y20_012375 [Prymnesium parvum]|uniref:Uncharacterized protein n=1 Tax=Prymnesium parvum TaxID=97485 RepID=A0AB34IQF3_PRYPA
MLALWAVAAAAAAHPRGANARGLSRALLRPRAVSTLRAGPPSLRGLAPLLDQYDAFLLDQFGVIHDGKQPYPGAVHALERLHQAGKKVVIISNSSRRRQDTLSRLEAMGFCAPLAAVTSGDLVWQALRSDETRPPFDGLGMRCFVFGNGEDDEEYVRSSGKVAAPVAQADFVLARGLFSLLGAGPDLLTKPALPYTAEREEQLLKAALAKRPGGLPLLVANPDEVRPDGKDSPMPGQLARRYQAMGGRDIRFVGKPYPLIYEACKAILADAGLPADARVAAVGDSLHHDVLGASRAGIDSVFVCGGVHHQALGVPQAQAVAPTPKRLTDLLDSFAEETGGVAPTHVVAGFTF